MLPRFAPALTSGLVCFVLFESAGTRVALAATPSAEAPAVNQTSGERSLAGFEVLASAAYAASTSQVRDMELEPYGVMLGLDFGYGFRSGFRLGGYLGYGFGRAVAQHRRALGGIEYDLTADSSSLLGAVSFGFDVPLHFLVLRYSLNLGGVAMYWDLSGAPPGSFFYEAETDSPAIGFYVAPGATLFFRRGVFEIGIGFDYLVQTNGAIPTGFVGELLTGVKW